MRAMAIWKLMSSRAMTRPGGSIALRASNSLRAQAQRVAACTGSLLGKQLLCVLLTLCKYYNVCMQGFRVTKFVTNGFGKAKLW